jgi:carboxylesterase
VPDILPGAEPASYEGGPHGALVLHGFTGCPQSMRPVAEAFAAAGFTTELPLLPGHGTSLDDMRTTSWSDWSKAAIEAYDDIAARCENVVVSGLSMGGTLAAWVAAERTGATSPAGIVLVNPALGPVPANVRDMMRQFLDQGIEVAAAIGNDVAKPGVSELAYGGIPVAALLSLFDAEEELLDRLGDIHCPALIMTSRNDHVVTPTNGDAIAERWGGPVERVWLERSFHVATIDHDAEDIQRRAVEFARKVAAGASA